MENSSTVIMLAAAFFAGIVLFVAALLLIRTLGKEKRLVSRRKTTSLHMAQVVSAAGEKKDGPAAGVSVIKKTEEEQPSEPVDGNPPEDGADESADSSADDSADGADGDSAEDIAGNSFDGSAEEPAGSAQSDDEPAGVIDGQPDGSPADDYGDEAGETQAVSLADVMADKDEDKPEASPQPEADEKALPAGPVKTQPVQPLPALQPAEGQAGGKPKPTGANINRRRLPETVKMKERKVLLAEDVKVNRELIAMFFEGSGVKFEFAENGKKACELFEENPGNYSLILLDIQMPVMDGYDAASNIRAMDIDWAKQIPIIAMTADTTEDAIGRCFEAGMDYHVAKPVDMEILQEKVFEFITRDSE